ncbi:MAG: DUF4097 family beta strand repeat-containing protein [Methanobacteriota archaeon]
MVPMRALAVLLLSIPAFAGCLGEEDVRLTDRDRGAVVAGLVPIEGPFGATVEDETSTGRDGGHYFAERTVTLRGPLAFDRLPVSVATVNGDVSVQGVSGDRWSAIARIRASGETAADAEANLAKVRFVTADEDGDVRALVLAATTDARRLEWSASFDVELPAAILYSLEAATVNGAVSVADLRTRGLDVETVNGDLRVEDSEVTRAEAATTNGDIDLRVVPTESGEIEAASTNGDVLVILPEDGAHGYDVAGATVNGRATVRLTEGEARGDEDHQTVEFRTRGYDVREVRTDVDLATTNGDVMVEPA